MTLDELDLQLVKELEIDARQGAHALAQKVGAKRTTVNNRLKRLLDTRIVTIRSITDQESLGFTLLFMIGISVRPTTTQAVLARLRPLEPIKSVVVTTGRYNMIAWAVFRSHREFLRFASQDLGSIPDVTGIDTTLLLERVKQTWRYFAPERTQGSDTRRPDVTAESLSPLQLSMLRELELDPRQTMTELATRVDSNRWIVTREFQKLLADETIRFVSIVDPLALGYTIRLVIMIKVNPSQIDVVADELARHRTTMSVGLITGDFQIYGITVFRDIKQISAFLSDTLDPMPGIVRYETIPILEWAKYTTRLLT